LHFYCNYSKLCSILPTMKTVNLNLTHHSVGCNPMDRPIIFPSTFSDYIFYGNFHNRPKSTAEIQSFCLYFLVSSGRHRQTQTSNFVIRQERFTIQTKDINCDLDILFIFHIYFLNFVHQSCTNCVCSGYYNNCWLPSHTICHSTVFK